MRRVDVAPPRPLGHLAWQTMIEWAAAALSVARILCVTITSPDTDIPSAFAKL